MPQTDLLSFPSTVFFLLLTFLGGYIIFVSYVLPQLLLISKVRNFLPNLTLSNYSISGVTTKLENGVSKDLEYIEKITKISVVIFFSLEDFLLALNFLNLILVLYFVIRSQILKSQTSSSLDLIKDLTDLKFSKHQLHNAVTNYELLHKELRNDISKALTFQYLIWLKNRNCLFFKPVSYNLFKLTQNILEEQRLFFQFEKNKRLYSQFLELKSNLNKCFIR